jgi:7,8-dihydroneopterin aldolase/epimerase/oxygenase
MVMCHLKDVVMDANIGVYAWERHRLQQIIINIWIEYDGTKAGKTDKISDTLDYGLLLPDIKNRIQETNFELLERLNEFVLDIIFEHPMTQYARVEIDKPEVLAEHAKSVSVTSERRRT